MPDASILVVNSGSSSLKFGAFTLAGDEEQLALSGSIDSIGHEGGRLKLKDGSGKIVAEDSQSARTLEDAFAAATQAMEQAGAEHPVAIGHRIVHGGPHLRRHQRLTPEVLDALKQAVHFAPLHDPPAIAILEAAQKHFPSVPQFVCFDTAFHRTLPEVATVYPIPTQYRNQGVMRYGFHGLSYESIVRTLGASLPPRLIVAHLGNGASLCAIRNGASLDTSMGLTPTGGIPMGTRTGDLDPGVLLWLLRSGLDVDQLESMVNHEAGLAALSDGESDMRALTKRMEQGDAPAALAINIFAQSIAKTIAAYVVSLGGLDALVFTGGIGENSAMLRAKVGDLLAPLAIYIDEQANQAGASQSGKDVISTADSASKVRVIATDEDGEIARHTRTLLHASS